MFELVRYFTPSEVANDLSRADTLLLSLVLQTSAEEALHTSGMCTITMAVAAAGKPNSFTPSAFKSIRQPTSRYHPSMHSYAVRARWCCCCCVARHDRSLPASGSDRQVRRGRRINRGFTDGQIITSYGWIECCKHYQYE
jgi:hypothetical protein